MGSPIFNFASNWLLFKQEFSICLYTITIKTFILKFTTSFVVENSSLSNAEYLDKTKDGKHIYKVTSQNHFAKIV